PPDPGNLPDIWVSGLSITPWGSITDRKEGYYFLQWYIIPKAPKGASQVWQVNKITIFAIDQDCKPTHVSYHKVDVWDIEEGPILYDKSGLAPEPEDCILGYAASKILGFDSGTRQYRPGTWTENGIGMDDVSFMLRTMRRPKLTQ